MADVKTISGVFTGAYALHPLTQEPVPIWIGDYVLAGYGTGAVMAVPCGDQRDYDFAKHFDISIRNIFEGADISKEAFTEKGKTQITDSDFLNGLAYKEAMATVIERLEKDGSCFERLVLATLLRSSTCTVSFWTIAASEITSSGVNPIAFACSKRLGSQKRLYSLSMRFLNFSAVVFQNTS